MKIATIIANSDLASKDYKGKPENVLIAVQMGLELGLSPMQAIQNIAVINGRGCVWGDAALALVQSSGKMEWIKEWHEGAVSYCSTKRKGYPDSYTNQFSDDDARAANLINKPGPWQTNKARMRQMRARAFNLRDQYADVLKGISMREEVEDYVEIGQSDQTVNGAKVAVMMPKRKSETANVEKTMTPEAQSSASVSETPPTQSQGDELVSQAQVKRLFAIAREKGVLSDEIKQHLKEAYGLEHTHEIKKANYEAIIDWVQSSREPGMEG